jgi:hypothetical protein
MMMLHILAVLLMFLSAGHAKYYLVETADVAKPNNVDNLGGGASTATEVTLMHHTGCIMMDNGKKACYK